MSNDPSQAPTPSALNNPITILTIVLAVVVPNVACLVWLVKFQTRRVETALRDLTAAFISWIEHGKGTEKIEDRNREENNAAHNRILSSVERLNLCPFNPPDAERLRDIHSKTSGIQNQRRTA